MEPDLWQVVDLFKFLGFLKSDQSVNLADDQARYCYEAQPEICKWNLIKLAEAIRDLLPLDRSKAAVEEM